MTTDIHSQTAEAAIEDYFTGTVLPVASTCDACEMVDWLRRQGRAWAVAAAYGGAHPHAAAIARYLFELAREVEDAEALASVKALLGMH
jgi:hypothetical protein